VLKNDNLWKIKRRHRGAVFNYMQRQAIIKMNKKVHELAARYNEAATRFRFGGFENNAILLRQQKIVGGECPQCAEVYSTGPC
jgi:helicase required for RNAi-mediated heterochromatin assembly 1